MTYNGELNELLLNVQRNMTEKQADNVTIDKKALSENIRNQEGNNNNRNDDKDPAQKIC